MHLALMNGSPRPRSGACGPLRRAAASFFEVAVAALIGLSACDAGGAMAPQPAAQGASGSAGAARPAERAGPARANGTALGGAPERAATPFQAASDGELTVVGRETLRSYVPAVGSFAARRVTQLGPQVSGRVEAVLVDVGDAVKKGQELVRLDPKLFEIEVALRKADLKAAQVSLAEAELNHTRMRNLFEKPTGGTPSVPRKLYDDAISRRDAAAARLEQAEEALRYAEERLGETVVRAPYDAVVTRRLVDPGEPVTSAPVSHVLEIQEVGVLELEFSLPQELLARIGPGTSVEFDVEGVEEGRGSGEIAVVFPAVDELTRSFRCRVNVDNSARKFRPGLLARVRVVDRQIVAALVVPRRALFETANGFEVVVSNDGHPVRRPVRVGMLTEDRAEVLEGLGEGDLVFVPAAKRRTEGAP